MTDDAYSPHKAVRHLDVLRGIREQQPVRPVHVQMILSDLCNHSCLVAGSLVDCPDGPRPIEDIRDGDSVYGPDGRVAIVREAFSREVDAIYEIRAGSLHIRASGDHPFLTERGWRSAESLAVGDRTAVRVRMRSAREVEAKHQDMGAAPARSSRSSGSTTRRRPSGYPEAVPMRLRGTPPVESAMETVGSIHLRPRPSEEAYALLEEAAAVAQGRGLAATAAVSLRLRQAGAPLPATLLDGLRRQAPATHRSDNACRATAPLHEDAACKPDVRSSRRHQGSEDPDGVDDADQGGAAFHHMVRATRSAASLLRHRSPLDRPTQSGLPRHTAAEDRRDHDEGHLQRVADRVPHREDIRGAVDTALRSPRMAMPRGVLLSGPPTPSPGGTGARGEGLLLEGIELERGLELRSIDSIRRINGRTRVYNFACPPIEAYEAQGFVVHNCGFCSYRDPNYTSSTLFYEVDEKNLTRGLRRDEKHPERNYNPNRMMPYGKALEILDDCKEMGVEAIQATGGGEPTLHPKWTEILAAAQERGLATSLVTNGINIHHGFDVVLKGAWTRISIDAGRQKTYTGVRNCPENHWTRVWDNVGELALRRRHSGSHLVIGVGFVVTPDNWQEIEEAAALAKRAGADNIRISAQFSADDEQRFAGFHQEAAAIAKRAEALTGDGFTVYNRFSEKLSDLKQKSPDYQFCGYQHFTTYIGADLNLYRCCVYAYHPHGLVAELKERRFKDVWMDVQRARQMRAFDATSCARCQFHTINRFMDYACREEEPDHAAFV